VKAMVGVLQQRYGLIRREEADGRLKPKQAEKAEATQVGFAW